MKQGRQPTVGPAVTNVAGAMSYLGISRSKLWQLTRDGELPSLQIGRARRYLLSDLDEFVGTLRGATK